MGDGLEPESKHEKRGFYIDLGLQKQEYPFLAEWAVDS